MTWILWISNFTFIQQNTETVEDIQFDSVNVGLKSLQRNENCISMPTSQRVCETSL